MNQHYTAVAVTSICHVTRELCGFCWLTVSSCLGVQESYHLIVDIPHTFPVGDFHCPITQEVMRDPVVAAGEFPWQPKVTTNHPLVGSYIPPVISQRVSSSPCLPTLFHAVILCMLLRSKSSGFTGPVGLQGVSIPPCTQARESLLNEFIHAWHIHSLPPHITPYHQP